MSDKVKTLTVTFHLIPAPDIAGVREALLSAAAALGSLQALPSVMSVKLPDGQLTGAVTFLPGELKP